MILFISQFGSSLPIVHRMNSEGVNTKIYVHSGFYQNSYDGIVEKIEMRNLRQAINDAEKVVFDSNMLNSCSSEDRALLQTLGLSQESRSVFGAIADSIKEKSIGASSAFDEYETDGVDARAFAGNLGIKSKSDVKGIDITAEMWFNGKEPVLFTYCISNRHLLTGDLGSMMNSQSNCLWIGNDSGLLTDELKRLMPSLTTKNYVGPVSVNCTVSSKDKKPYFNDWKFGFRYDNIFSLLALSKSVSSFFLEDYKLDATTRDFSCSERVTIAPYPYTSKELLSLAKDVNIKNNPDKFNGFWYQDIKKDGNKLKCAGNDGIIGVMTYRGNKIEHGFRDIYKAIKELNIDAPIQFRIDGSKETNKKYKKLIDWKVCVN